MKGHHQAREYIIPLLPDINLYLTKSYSIYPARSSKQMKASLIEVIYSGNAQE